MGDCGAVGSVDNDGDGVRGSVAVSGGRGAISRVGAAGGRGGCGYVDSADRADAGGDRVSCGAVGGVCASPWLRSLRNF